MRRLLPARLVAALGHEAASRLDLPSDIVHESRRRVRVAAAMGSAAYAVVFVFALSGVVEATSLGRRIDLTHDVIGLCLCASLLLLASLQSFADRHVLAAALVVEVLLSALISFSLPWASFVRTGDIPNLTWVVPIIILFPLLVPTPPRTALAVSMLCALTMPAGLWVLGAMRRLPPQPANYWATCLTAAIGVGIASIASRTVYGAGRQIAAARTIGSYELLEKLGEGGMGEVWRARHLMLARPAAVKLILPERLRGASEERDAALQRFTREAQVTAGLRSAHTVQLFDFGVTADGSLYYAMELLSGMTVEHFVYRFGPVEPRRAVHWLQQACHSLAEAHSQNLVHRDIKPANVFLCRYGRDVDFVKILDFGLTRPIATQDDRRLTSPGWLVGTPGYMAPEQVFGLETGPSTDLYALGCVAYWLLAGVRPFDAESPGELLRQHVHAPPPPFSQKVETPIPAPLETLVMRCLSKDPADRPRDADELSRGLDRCLESEPWSPVEAHDWWQRNLAEV
jgi:serine/threonine-protein kinase